MEKKIVMSTDIINLALSNMYCLVSFKVDFYRYP